MPGNLVVAWMRETASALERKIRSNPGNISHTGSIPNAGIAKILSPDDCNEVAAGFLSGEIIA